MGGFTEVVNSSLEWALRPYEANPRANEGIEGTRQRLSTRVPELRARLQGLLTRIQFTGRRVNDSTESTKPARRMRTRLPHGSYPEIEIQATKINWRGFADLLTLTDSLCEIREFKTGKPIPEHETQIRTYAVLWARDTELNPHGRLANRLVLSYDTHDQDVPVPTESEIPKLENELRQQASEALAFLQVDPPEARPSEANCTYCFVRHLCGEYWNWTKVSGSNEEKHIKDGFGDVQVEISGQLGARSWGCGS